MKQKLLYEAPVADQLNFQWERSFCESANAPDYNLRTDFSWDDQDL